MNLNDMVRVKLKPEGFSILQQAHDKLEKFVRQRGGELGDWSGPKIDAEGYYRTQLWCLMQDFGPHIRLGAEAPFETEILLDSSSEADQRDAALEDAARSALYALGSLPVNYASAECEALRLALQRHGVSHCEHQWSVAAHSEPGRCMKCGVKASPSDKEESK